MKPALRMLAALLALTIVAASCSSDDSATEADDSDAERVAGAVEDVAVSIVAVSFDSSTVTIRNDGDTELTLDGLVMCNRPNYTDLPAGTLAAGETMDVDVTELDIRGSGGEFGLYTSSSFDSADAMVAYVQWGGPTNGRASVAVEAGLIAEEEFVDNGGEDFTLE